MGHAFTQLITVFLDLRSIIGIASPGVIRCA